ncbi:uncharacterized protein UV8b_07522 [Ustilaginoidea virens]|uniref:Uncharacterized protein n=1 Tax=Ustilaginoidea virens TaxID=1159556 RepID=A0A8E5MKP2_USTVR|nr:uncharacterized protein UV8b_07522 [Ustilaginoidea virens]QUC23281.1 hypothetical protein UV8b_07522 [Ustilaginoidea virens]
MGSPTNADTEAGKEGGKGTEKGRRRLHFQASGSKLLETGRRLEEDWREQDDGPLQALRQTQGMDGFLGDPSAPSQCQPVPAMLHPAAALAPRCQAAKARRSSLCKSACGSQGRACWDVLSLMDSERPGAEPAAQPPATPTTTTTTTSSCSGGCSR